MTSCSASDSVCDEPPVLKHGERDPLPWRPASARQEAGQGRQGGNSNHFNKV